MSLAHLLELSEEQLRTWCQEHGQPGYRAAQVRRGVLERRAASFEAMTDLPKSLRVALDAEFCIFSTEPVVHRKADDGSEKLLLKLSDGETTECVVLRDDRGHCTVCVSTQVGCGMGCAFCASGLGGLVRNLTQAEILEEILQLQRLLAPTERLSHIVVMGMGEPLANLDNLLPVLETANKELGIGARRVTISTVGLPKGIRRLADLNCQYHLAVSLHAADDELRDRILPANRAVGIAAALEAADYYFEKTGRRVTYEYVLLADMNDRPGDARRLVQLLRGRPSLVNLIPYNPVEGMPFHTPRPAAVEAFAETLRKGGLNCEIRRRKGDQIDAACGQLRRKERGRGEDGIRD